MLLRAGAFVRSARPSTSHPRLAVQLSSPLSPSTRQFLHSSTALPARKKETKVDLAQTEPEQPPEWNRLRELVEDHKRLGDSHIHLQGITSPKTEWPYLENVAAALLRPIPTELPPLPPTLDKEVFRMSKGESARAPHYEVLEWNGDRELNNVAAQVLVVLSPTGFRSSRLGWHSAGLMKLITGKAATVFAEQLGMARRFNTPVSQNTLANRFESYVGALWACKGSGAVLEFLAPLFGREMLKFVLDDVKEVLEVAKPVKPVKARAPAKVAVENRKSSATAISPVKEKKKAPYTTPLSYATLNEAKSRFVEDLKNGGWENWFGRGKRSMHFSPPKQKPACVRFVSNEVAKEDGLTKLLLEAAKVGSIVIQHIPPDFATADEVSEALGLNSPALKPSKAEEKARKKAEAKLVEKPVVKTNTSAPKAKAKRPKLSLRGEIAKTKPSKAKKPLTTTNSVELSPSTSSPVPIINPSFFL